MTTHLSVDLRVPYGLSTFLDENTFTVILTCNILDIFSLGQIIENLNFIFNGWLVVSGLTAPLRQHFRLYRAVSQREGGRGGKG